MPADRWVASWVTPTRVLFVLLGAIWAVRSVQAFADPHSTEAESQREWFAIVSFSLALALLSAGLPLLVARTRRDGRRTVQTLAVVVALAAITASVANVVEDGLGVESAGLFYGVGIGAMTLTLLVLAAVLLIAGSPRWPGLVVLGTFVGLIGLEIAGGVLILAVWVGASLAVQPEL